MARLRLFSSRKELFGSVGVGEAQASCGLCTHEVRTGQYYGKPASILIFEFRIQDFARCRLKTVKFTLKAKALPTSEQQGPFPPECAEEIFCTVSPGPCYTAPAISAFRQEIRQRTRVTRARKAMHPGPYEAFGGMLEWNEDNDVSSKAIWTWQADPWSNQGAQQQILYGGVVIRTSENPMQLSMRIKVTPAGWHDGTFQPSAKCTTVTPVIFGEPRSNDFHERVLDLENRLKRLNGADLVETVEQLDVQDEVDKTWNVHPDSHHVKDTAQSCDPDIGDGDTWFYQCGSSYAEDEDDGCVYDYCWAVENDAPIGEDAAGVDGKSMWFVQCNNAKIDNRGPATVWDQCWAVHDIGWAGIKTAQEHAAEIELSDEEDFNDEEDDVDFSISGQSDAVAAVSPAESSVTQHEEDKSMPSLRPTGSVDDEFEDVHRHFAAWAASSPFASKEPEDSWASSPTMQVWEVGLPCWPKWGTKRGIPEDAAIDSMHRAKRTRTAVREITH